MGREKRDAMARGTVCLVALALALAGAAEAGATVAVVRHTRIQAERNVLHAHRALRRLDPRLVDPRTGLPRTDTTVVCRGRGRRVGHAWPRFVCTISYHGLRLAVRYDAQRGNGFELHRIRRHR